MKTQAKFNDEYLSSHLSKSFIKATYQGIHDLILYVDRCRVDFYDLQRGDEVGDEVES